MRRTRVDLQVAVWVLLTSESIEDSVIEDYLPETFERVDGALVKQPVRCEDYLLPGPGLFNAGATSIVSLDLDALDAPLGSATLLGYAEGVYANDDVLLIRQTDYGDYTQPLPAIRTNIHRFALDGAATTYNASGSVAGYVPTSFGLDEGDGVIRAVTTQDRYQIEPVDGGESYIYLGASNRVVTLAAEGDTLVELGQSADIGADNYVYQSHFAGDYAYLFTYGQSGNLFVVDVTNPAAPALAGQTAVNAYGGPLVPLRTDQLLSVSQVIDPTGSFSQLGVQLLDVSDPTAPGIASEYVFPQQGYSDASYDPRALSPRLLQRSRVPAVPRREPRICRGPADGVRLLLGADGAPGPVPRRRPVRGAFARHRRLLGVRPLGRAHRRGRPAARVSVSLPVAGATVASRPAADRGRRAAGERGRVSARAR